jgi:hypothetical protein
MVIFDESSHTFTFDEPYQLKQPDWTYAEA